MKVAVIIPCYNVEAYVGRALASALAQDHDDIEVVCVDDGSTDDTPALLRDLAARSGGRVQVIFQDNRGASAARNRGMMATRSEWIQFLDGDDALLPDKISRQLALATNADLVVGDYEQVMPNGLLLPVLAQQGAPWMGLIKTKLGTTSANLWRREAVLAAGGWREDLQSSQDYELMFRMLQHDARVVCDGRIATVVLKREEGSISRTSERENWHRYIALRRSMLEYLKARDPKVFAAEIAALEQYIFMALRIVATYDLDRAVEEFKRCMSRGFVPEVGRAITERYVMLYKLLGFANTERLLRKVKGGGAPST